MLGKTINAFQRKITWILSKSLTAIPHWYTGEIHTHMHIHTYTHRCTRTHTPSFFMVFYAFRMIEYNALMFLSMYLVGKNDTHRRKIPRD